MDILKEDGTFRKYYKNSNLKEKVKIVNNEYDSEIINYLYRRNRIIGRIES